MVELIILEGLLFSNFCGEFLNFITKFIKASELSLNFFAVCLSNLRLARRALHEGEVDLESVPAVLEERLHTLSVENVTAAKHDVGLTLELTSVADGAKFVTSRKAGSFLVAVRVEARHALSLALDTVAPVATCHDLLGALNSTVIVLGLAIA